MPWPLIYAVTFWSSPHVRQHGAFVEIEPDVGCDAGAGRASVGLAIFLILEFSQPYTGWIRVSPAPLEQAILQLDQPSVADPSGAAEVS